MGVTSANLWTVAGLVYALAGVALVFNAVYLSPAPSRTGSGTDASAFRRMFGQWLDARVGAALVVVGFFLQATGTVGTSTLNTPAVFVLLGLALAASYYALMRDLIIEDLVSSHERDLPVPVTPLTPMKLVPPVAVIAEEPKDRIEASSG